MGSERGSPLRRVDVQHPAVGRPQIQSLQEPQMAALGNDEAAVGMGDVACQLRALPGGVDAHHRRPGHGRCSQQHGVFRTVVQERTYMERPRSPAVQEQMGSGNAAGGEFPVGVLLLFEQHGRAVVVSPAQHQISNGGEGFSRGVHKGGS